MVSNQLRHDLAPYKTLPFSGFEKVALINAVLIQRIMHAEQNAAQVQRQTLLGANAFFLCFLFLFPTLYCVPP